MKVGRWYRLSGDRPDLGLPATSVGTRYLRDGDPACDPVLNPARRPYEALRRLAGRAPLAPWSGRVGFSAITEAWNGAVLATRFGDSGSLIIFGGGHNNYFGSDVHAFDLATREWRRISDGFVQGSPEQYGEGASYPNAEYPDGSPLPPHTYGYVQYDAVGNDYLILKGNSELGPNVKAVATPHMFNLDCRQWRRGAVNDSAILNSGGFTAWDASRRVLWGHSGDDGGGNAFIGFCPDGANADGTFGCWGPLHSNKFPGNANHNAMQIDPTRDIIVVPVHVRDALFGINPADPDAPAVALNVSGSRPRIAEYAALAYAPNLDRLIYYSARDGAALHAIAAPKGRGWSALTTGEWGWERCAGDGLDPIADAKASSRYATNWRHTFGRFRVASWGSIDVALLIRHVDTPVYARRLI
ncbi:MAG: kelch motif-containing protein [Steroidobacteraceae bacterium]|nr:kelch motif-containing protein [Steroidobacteraceae bacterium]